MSSPSCNVGWLPWGWPGTVAVVVVLALPSLVVLRVELYPGSALEAPAATVGFAAHTVVLAAAVIFYFAWRLAAAPELAWLAMTFTALGIEDFERSLLRVTTGGGVDGRLIPLLAVEGLCLAVVSALLVVRKTAPPPVDPMVLGLTIGLVTSMSAGTLALRSSVVTPGSPLLVSALVLVPLYLCLFEALRRTVRRPRWARRRITAAVVLLACNNVIPDPALGSLLPGSIALVSDAVAAALLCTTALGWLRLAIHDNTQTLLRLRDRTVELEARDRADRERLHVINSAIAGIVAGSRLVHEEKLPMHRRNQLEQMVESEILRLAELLAPNIPPPREVDLDAALEPIVTAQRVLGRSVDWTPSGQRVLGRPEEVGEIVTVLLENAAQHARGSPVTLHTRLDDDQLELVVSDSGPGVAPEVRDDVFTWGRRGPRSHGQGIGLSVARRLAEDMGGNLTCSSTPGRGARFAVRLQLAGSRQRDRSVLA